MILKFKTKNMKKILSILLILSAIYTSATNVTTSSTANYIVGTSAPYNALTPGDTLFIIPGVRDHIQIRSIIGSALHPIVIINKGGVVNIGIHASYGIKLAACRYIKLTGTGTADSYGFWIHSESGDGVSEDEMSSDIETCFIRTDSCGLRGITSKTDPACGGYAYRSNFTQYNTIIHNCYINYTVNEGMYIGNTHYTGWDQTCSGNDSLLMPSVLIHVRIYNNIVKYAGWDGIQVSSATQDCKIYNNLILFPGTSDTPSQNAGIMVGGGDSCFVFSNYIYKGKEDGMDVFAFAGSIYDNEIWYPDFGSSQPSAHGIYVGDVAGSPTGYAINFIGNLIVSPKNYGIDFASTASVGSILENNVILNTGSGYIATSTGNTTQRNNYENATVANAKLSDTLGNQQSTSPLRDAGYSVPSYITTDYLGNPRVVGSSVDIGPVEYQGGGSPPATPGTISGTTSQCSTNTGQGYSISSVSGATSYTWSVPSGWTITAGQGTVSLTTNIGSSGNVSVVANNSYGSSSASTLAITVSSIPATPASITGSATQSPTVSATYSTSVSGATSYTWTVPTGWTINSGQSTSSITVTTGTVGQNGNVAVTATNSCGTSSAKTLAVTVSCSAPATPGTITGTATQTASVTSTYSIASVTGATTYTWSVPTGWTLNSGQGTISVSITSGAVGQNGNISVTAGSSCGTSSARTLAVTVTGSAPATPTSVTGNNNPCPKVTGLSYSITAVPTATSYTWSMPTGWTITHGQGTTVITVTSGSYGQNGNIGVKASNSYGSSSILYYPVTVNHCNCPCAH
jgi:PKD-like domain